MSVNMKQNGSLTKIASLTKAIIPMGLAECYSTEEKEVGAWVDGKPLYQKTIDFGALPNNTSKSVSHGVANIDKIVHAFGIGVSATSFLIIPFVTVESGRYQVGLEVSTTDIIIYTDYNRSSLYGYVTIQYTKTTDTAGSGTWTPSGAQAIHYSTAEQIIGTYLGKPLYCKVINFSSPVVCNPQQWATTEVPTSSLNVETLVNSVCAYDGVNYPCAVSCDTNDTYVSILNVRTVALSVKTLIIEYTKTTD